MKPQVTRRGFEWPSNVGDGSLVGCEVGVYELKRRRERGMITIQNATLYKFLYPGPALKLLVQLVLVERSSINKASLVAVLARTSSCDLWSWSLVAWSAGATLPSTGYGHS
jgi:hypothetical protein